MPWLIALVVSLAWLYGSTIANLIRTWISSADASYGLVLAVVAGVVAWRRRSDVARIAAGSRHSVASGLSILLAGLVLYTIGQLAADAFLTRTSLVIVLAGTTAVAAGPVALRRLAVPLVFLFIAMPLPALIVNTVTLPLQLVASRIAELTLALASVPVFREGNLLTLPSSTLEVAEACSGLRSLVSLAAIAVLLAWTLERRSIVRLALIASAIPIAVVVNGLRIAATGLAVEHWGAAAGKGAWHELTGWMTFVVALGALFAVKRWLTLAAVSSRRTPEGLVAA